MIIDHLAQSIQIKICYFGTALSGKTTSIKALFDHFGMAKRVISVVSTIGRTLFFDYGKISFESEKWIIEIHLYSTTGQDFYIITRPTTLKGLDGFIFVIDSQKNAYYRNLTSWYELCNYYENQLVMMPKVFAFNKQDLPDLFEPSRFMENINYFNFNNLVVKTTIAVEGEGILSCFEDLLGLIFNNLSKPQLSSLVTKL
jgi:signal recognition particle receptor subunit beta